MISFKEVILARKRSRQQEKAQEVDEKVKKGDVPESELSNLGAGGEEPVTELPDQDLEQAHPSPEQRRDVIPTKGQSLPTTQKWGQQTDQVERDRAEEEMFVESLVQAREDHESRPVELTNRQWAAIEREAKIEGRTVPEFLYRLIARCLGA